MSAVEPSWPLLVFQVDQMLPHDLRSQAGFFFATQRTLHWKAGADTWKLE
jgi:hypothetical protein